MSSPSSRTASAEQGWNREADPAPLHAAFKRWAAPARALVDSVETWRCWSLYQLAPLKRWTEGRIALLGDAAHPVLPYLAQGAALAIEDAATLAASLEAARGDDLLAFPHYEALRRARVRRVQRAASRYGLLYHLGSPLSLARNFVLGRRRPEALLAGFDWLYRHRDPATGLSFRLRTFPRRRPSSEQDDGAGERREQRSCKHGELGDSYTLGIREGEQADEKTHGEADAAQDGDTIDLAASSRPSAARRGPFSWR